MHMDMSQEMLNTAVKEAFADVIELQKISTKRRLTGAEVQKLYGISKSRLEKMRLDGEGPRFSKPADTGKNTDRNTSTVYYDPKDVEAWLDSKSVRPL